MKKSCVWSIVCVLLCFSMPLGAQVIKVENGIAVTTGRLKGTSLGTMYPYQMSIGIDYWDHSWFDLSSNVGYIRKGSKDDIEMRHSSEETPYYGDFILYADYITLNTTFRLKRNVRRETYYIGVGPRLDFKTKEHFTTGLDTEGEDFNSVLYGLKCEAGFNYTINKIQVGVNASYLPSFNKQINEIRERTFTFGISVGYILN